MGGAVDSDGKDDSLVGWPLMALKTRRREHPNSWLSAQFTACQDGWVARRETKGIWEGKPHYLPTIRPPRALWGPLSQDSESSIECDNSEGVGHQSSALSPHCNLTSYSQALLYAASNQQIANLTVCILPSSLSLPSHVIELVWGAKWPSYRGREVKGNPVHRWLATQWGT